MDPAAAQKQVDGLVNEILSGADNEAAKITRKGDEEFNVEVQKIITEQKTKILATYERKTKTIETQYAIAKSTAINKQRLQTIKARQHVVNQIAEDVKGKLKEAGQDKAFVTKLILQGTLMLLESEVLVRCRQADAALVESCLSAASTQYAEVIKKETGATKSLKLTVDQSEWIPADSLGGIVLTCQGGKIKIDNTVNVRLNLVMEQDKPAIRQLLFGN
eukprot:TRINITY_DN83568_c0_g1_i1.p1 TRINITY_DN83568_c0_g1~~TRINITY_DN83568_c0_g1_i1.p1  ORF type:complete len:219 (-),score=64.97 TRINITY_DN83568_c0_g1_i1:90-746(-)